MKDFKKAPPEKGLHLSIWTVKGLLKENFKLRFITEINHRLGFCLIIGEIILSLRQNCV